MNAQKNLFCGGSVRWAEPAFERTEVPILDRSPSAANSRRADRLGIG